MSLPANYPFADASDADIRSWLAAVEPPFASVRSAAPWLGSDYEVIAYLDGIRMGLAGLPFEPFKSREPK